jgi:hypothetical protein
MIHNALRTHSLAVLLLLLFTSAVRVDSVLAARPAERRWYTSGGNSVYVCPSSSSLHNCTLQNVCTKVIVNGSCSLTGTACTLRSSAEMGSDHGSQTLGREATKENQGLAGFDSKDFKVLRWRQNQYSGCGDCLSFGEQTCVEYRMANVCTACRSNYELVEVCDTVVQRTLDGSDPVSKRWGQSFQQQNGNCQYECLFSGKQCRNVIIGTFLPTPTVQPTLLPSASPSATVSRSVSPSATVSATISISTSVSPSTSPSISVASPSVSVSATASVSSSVSPSTSTSI